PPALDDPAVHEERDDRLQATVFRAGRPVRNRSASPLHAPHLSAATHTREPSVDLSTAPNTRPSRLPLGGLFRSRCGCSPGGAHSRKQLDARRVTCKSSARSPPLKGKAIVPKFKLKDNIPKLDCALTEVKSSAGAAIPHESEVKLPSNNDTAPETPYPAKKKNSSAAVTPVKTPKTPKTLRASKRKLEFPEGKDAVVIALMVVARVMLAFPVICFL
ncbi:hypothetical protein H9Q72_014491, partial [Fusarium xylarioides]